VFVPWPGRESHTGADYRQIESTLLNIVRLSQSLNRFRATVCFVRILAEENGYISSEGYPRFSAWLVAMLFIAFSVWVGYGAGTRIMDRRSAIRWALGIGLGGLATYNYLVFGFFGIKSWLIASGLSGVIIIVFIGEILGFVAGWIWSRQ